VRLPSLCAERALSVAETRARTTGALEWRQQRGELGEGVHAAGAGGEGRRVVAKVARVCGAVGCVVHGLCFEGADGTRGGTFLENSKEAMDLTDDAGLVRRGGVWEALAPHEAVVGVKGVVAPMGYLCAEIVLKLSSGRELRIAGTHVGANDERFEAAAPEGEAIVGLFFGDGMLIGVETAAWAGEG
jgi:hypothetical protein